MSDASKEVVRQEFARRLRLAPMLATRLRNDPATRLAFDMVQVTLAHVHQWEVDVYGHDEADELVEEVLADMISKAEQEADLADVDRRVTLQTRARIASQAAL